MTRAKVGGGSGAWWWAEKSRLRFVEALADVLLHGTEVSIEEGDVAARMAPGECCHMPAR